MDNPKTAVSGQSPDPASRQRRELDELIAELEAIPGVADRARLLEEAQARRGEMLATLRVQRLAAGLTLADVAAVMATSQPAVARLEAGLANPSIYTLEHYAAAIGCRIIMQVEVVSPLPA